MRRVAAWSVPLFAAVLAGFLFPAPAAAADGELTFAIGALLGDDLTITQQNLEANFNDSPVYGGRLGWFGYPLGVEGSLMVSPSGVPDPDDLVDVDVRVIYGEVNLVVVLIPGPISPFVTGGVGLHSFNFDAPDVDLEINQLGYNWGGGVKANAGPVVLRFDVRDHVTSFDIEDFAPILDEIFELDDNTLHNIEVTAGIGFRF